MILVIAANSNTCRMYHYNKKNHPQTLTLYKELSHPENKLKDIDLTSDKPGRYKAGNGSHGAYSQRSDPKDVKIDEFSREIANELNQERNQHDFEHLIVIAPPHVTGLLFQHLNKHVKELITKNIQKDILHLPNHELLDFLKTNTQYSD